MIDYLEMLLEEQEQEENGSVPEWRRPAPFRPTGMAAQNPTLTDEELSHLRQAEAMLSETVERSIQAGIDLIQKSVSAPAAEAEQKNILSTDSLSAQIGRLRRSVQRADVQINRQSAPGVEHSIGNGSLPWDRSPSLSKTANYASLVDAAFARDARRYDGPLGLL